MSVILLHDPDGKPLYFRSEAIVGWFDSPNFPSGEGISEPYTNLRTSDGFGYDVLESPLDIAKQIDRKESRNVN